MRRLSITIAFAALLVSGAANAAGGSDKEPGKGAQGPSAGPTDSPGGGKNDAQLSELSDTRGYDTRITAKAWEVGVGVEYHHLVDPDYVDNGAGRNVLYYSLFGRWDLTPYDRLSIRYGVYQTAVIDQADSRVRSDDIVASYTRRIPLPGAVTLRASFALTAPVSYASQLATLITSPRISFQADRHFGKYFSLDGRLGGTLFITREATGAGLGGGGIAGNGTPNTSTGDMTTNASNPNPFFAVTLALSADLAMPFHEPLSVGVSVYDGYSWVRNVGCNSASSGYTGSGSAFGMSSVSCPPTTNGAQTQPFFQAWGGEVYVRYAMPTLGGFKSDLSASFAPNGDPTLGYASATHGTGEFQSTPFYYRQSAEVYFAVTGRY